jgi:tetratricopeptide (TPR) repeat protein
LLRSFFHLSENESNEERIDKIKDLISLLCPKLADWASLIGELLSIEMPESQELKMLDPKLRHQRLLDMILELLMADAKRSKILLLFEDVQWADSVSLELLNYVTRNVRDCHMLVGVVYRTEEFAGLDSREQENHVEIALRELSERLTINLIQSITGMHDVPKDLGELVVDTAQGNPLCVEEMIGSIIDAGYLTQNAESGAYEPTRSIEEIEVPDTIQGIIMERLDQLGEETLNILKAASVVGKSFQYAALRDILDTPASESDFMKNLGQLISLNMVMQLRDKPEPEYYFKHSVTQEVAYASMSFAQRRSMHDKLGRYLEARHKDEIEQYYELLCHHYVRAENGPKATEYSIKAGDKAKKVFSNLEAINYFCDGLRFLRSLPRVIPALEGIVEENLGDVYELTGAYDRALESYQQSQQKYRILARRGRRTGSESTDRIPWVYANLPSSTEGGRLAAAIYRKRSVVHERKGQYNIAINYLDRGIAQITNDPIEMARFYTAKAGVLYRMGHYRKAFEWCQRALEVSGESTKCEETAHSYYLLGTICTDLGNLPQAIEYRMKALVIYEQLSDLVGQARVHNNLGVDFYYQGNWEMAKVHYRRSLQIRSKIGDVSGTATVSNNLGEILSDQGHLDEAEQSFQTCLKTWGNIGYTLGVGLSNSNLGRVYTRRGEWQRALEYLGKSYQIFEQLHSQGFLTEVQQRLAEAYLDGGQTQAAIENCQRSLALAKESDRPLVAGVSHRIMGQAYVTLGDLNEAEREFAQSEKILRELSATYELGNTLWQMVLFYHEKDASKGRENAAAVVRQLLESALDIFKRLGIRSDAAKVAELKKLYLVE